MKNIFKFLSFLFIFTYVFSFISCNTGEKNEKFSPNDLVVNYTQGVIDRNRDIFIVFNKEIDSTLFAKNNNTILDISPETSGKLEMVDKKLLKFVPQKLKPDTKYKVSVNLKKIFSDIKKNNNKFSFVFKTMPLMIDLSFSGLTSDGKSAYVLKGTLTSNDSIDESKLSSLFTIKYSGNSKPEVEFKKRRADFNFYIKNIQRDDVEKILKIVWDASNLGSKTEGETTFYIPAINTFNVMDYSVVNKTPTELVIRFSSPLKRNQELEGLIHFQSLNAKPEISINDNLVYLKFEKNIVGDFDLIVERGVKDIDGQTLNAKYINKVFLKAPAPAVKLLGDGVITPGNGIVRLPFEAINLNAIDLQITKVYSNNVMQFLQNNYLNSGYIPPETGDIQFVKKIDIENSGTKNENYKWKKYALDLSEYVDLDKSAIYNVKIGFRKSYTDYPCTEDHSKMFEETGMDKPPADNKSFWQNWISYEGFEWEQRSDPCFPAFYTSDHFVQKNILATDLGISAKQTKEGVLYVFVNDLLTSAPKAKTKVSIYTYSRQLLGEKNTSSNGIAIFDMKDKKPHFIVAYSGNDYAYLAMTGNMQLETGDFDIGGKRGESKIDGFIYGERGVWRPGDSLFISFILSKGESDIPEDHPVQFELKNPFGKSYFKTTTNKHTGPIYKFITKTKQSDPTGNWMAIVSIGNNKFYKKLKIETVKPNRLKIDIDFNNPNKKFIPLNSLGNIEVKWLNGLPAANINVRLDAYLKNISPKFDKYKQFVFYDRAGYLEDSELSVFDEDLDENGKGNFKLNLSKNNHYPGMLKMDFKVKAFEKSGEFSTDYFSKTISPYKEYTGINFPKNSWGEYQVKRGSDNEVSFVVTDQNGNPVPNRKIEVKLYNARWRWWWDNSARDIANYLSDMSISSFKTIKLTTDAKGMASTKITVNDWGTYLLRACDRVSGHCSSLLFYSGYYGGDSDNNDFASKLKFQLDKKSYNIGDKAKLTIPAGAGNRILIAIEKDGDIRETTSQVAPDDVFDFDFDIEKWMFPNVYIHVSVLKPAINNTNDLPIRRYGIVPLEVTNKDKKIALVVDVPEVIKPESEYTIKVSEKNNKPMAYTIAVVDEGLLNLTHFRTPSPYDYFFAKRASSINSWDVYNFVQKSSNVFFDRIISVGGDDEMVQEESANKANRFVPVVRYIGPFYLKKGGTKTHKLKIQNYSGSVRVMVVAAGDGRYGSFAKSVKVKDDLMLLPAAPRVLSPGETFEVPVTVFATTDKVKDVDVMLETNSLFTITGVRNNKLHFDKPGEKLTYFEVKVNDKLGVGTLDFNVNSGRYSATKHLEIAVDNPNPFVKKSKLYTLEKGAKQDFNIEKAGMEGTNSAVVEVSLMPGLEIEQKLHYLMHYPYGCIEQTTSSAFPLVHLKDMIQMPVERIDKINYIVRATIKRLKRFQLNNGGFSYWPGDSYISDWGTSYATHFLIEAQNSGYNVNDLLDNALKYLEKKSASKISSKKEYKIIDLTYDLMLLAKSGRPNRATMNYMRNNVKLPVLAGWYLALAYAFTGDNDIAKELYEKSSNDIKDYVDVYYTYGSPLRDYSVKLLLLNKLGLKKQSALLAKDIIIDFNKNWHSTQTTSYALIALTDYSKSMSDNLNFSYSSGDEVKNIKLGKPVYSFEVNEDAMSKLFTVENKDKKSVIFVNVISIGKPLQTETKAENSNIDMDITYVDKEGHPLNVSNLKMGQEFKAIVKIKKLNNLKDYRNIAVNQVFPGGWEILNWRMGAAKNENTYYIRYQDIRDDRVYSFLDMDYQSGNGKIEIPLVATFPGRFYMPVQYVQSMYDNTIFAKKPANWIKVSR